MFSPFPMLGLCSCAIHRGSATKLFIWGALGEAGNFRKTMSLNRSPYVNRIVQCITEWGGEPENGRKYKCA